MKTRKKLNLRFLAVLVVVLAVVGTCVHFVHAFQIKRNAKGLLYQADKAKERGETAKEIDYLYRYLGFVRDDPEALPRYAELVDDQAKEKAPRGMPRKWAFANLDRALRQDPSRSDLRRRAIDAAMDLGGDYLSDARAHLEVLYDSLKERKDEEAKRERAELLRLKGLCLARSGRYNEAVKAFKEALKYVPDQVENIRDIAVLLQEQLNQPDEALTRMAAMVKAESPLKNSPQARLTYAKFLFQYRAKTDKDLEEAKKAADEALGLAPQDPEAIMLVAELSQVLKKPDEARELLVEGIKANPNEPTLYLRLIALKIDENKQTSVEEALQIVQQGLEKLPNNSDLLHALAELQVLNNKPEEAKEIIAKLRKAKYPDPLLHYLEARIFIRESDWGKARPLLEKAATELTRRPGLEVQALLLLGQSHEQLGNPDEALLAYLKAQKLDAFSLMAHFRAAVVLTTLRRYNEALAELERVREFPNRPRSMHILVARALIALSSRLPAKEIKERVREIKSELKLADPDSRELPILRAQVILLEDPKKVDDARQVIETAKTAHPRWVELWIALAQLAARDVNPVDPQKALDKALKILDEAQKELPDSIEVRLTRLAYRVVLPLKTDATQEEREKAMKAMLEKVRAIEAEETREVKVKASNLPPWWGGLADAYVRLGGNDDAARLWNEIAQKQPNNLAVRLLLFDQALMSGSDEKVKQIIKDMRDIEGSAGTFWRYAEASRRIQAVLKEKETQGATWQLTSEHRQFLREARRYLADAAKQRTSWSRIPALQAEIYDLEGDKTTAIEKFKESLKKGERRPVVIRRLVQVLYEQLSPAEAQIEAGKVVSDHLVDEAALVEAGLGKWVAGALMNKQDDAQRHHAAELAAQSVSPDSKSYRDYLWLGRVQWAAKQPKNAEKSLEKACKLGAESPETWVTLVAFLVDTKDKEKARAMVTQAKDAKLPPKQRPLALAACYELLGDPNDLKEAEKYLQQALDTAAPEDQLSTRYSVASYFLRHGNGAEAKKHLDYLIKNAKPGSRELFLARRVAALILAEGIGHREFEEAVKLVDQNLREAKDTSADRRAKAIMLATRNSERKEAIRLLEQLDQNETLAAPLRFTLVRLYLAEGKGEEARRHMGRLQAGGIVADYHAYYARHLLQRGTPDDITEAAAQLRLLEQAHPKASITKEIKARVLKAQSKDALGAAHEYAQSPGVEAGRAALLLEELSRQKEVDAAHQQRVVETYRQEADKMYREYTKSKKPESFLLLAEFLGRQQRVLDALDCCEKALDYQADPSAVAPIMTAVLREGVLREGELREGILKEQCKRVENRLNKLLVEARTTKGAKTAPLLLSLADVYDFQGRFLETEDLYKQVLVNDPENLWALNNLAWLLVFKKGGDKAQALEMINTAISLAGPSAELLDTRAVIYLELQQADKAVQDMIKVIDLAPTGSRYFHLARVWKAIADRERARGATDNAKKASNKFKEAWKKVVDSGLQLMRVHSLERDQYTKLSDEFLRTQ